MNRISHIDCPALLKEADKQLRIAKKQLKEKDKFLIEKDKIIHSLQDQNSALHSANRSLEQLSKRQDAIIAANKVHIEELTTTNRLQKETIGQLSGQLTLLQETISSLKQKVDEQGQLITHQDKQLTLANHHKKVLNKTLFGRKSEKSRKKIHAQTVGMTTGDDAEGAKIIYTGDWLNAKEHKPRGKTGELDKNLPRETTILVWKDAPENAIIVDKEVTETLECRPASYYVKRVIRYVYLVPDEKKEGCFTNHREPLPAHPLPKCKAGISMLTKLVVDKFAYAQPVYRQHQRMGYEGLQIPYTTAVDWTNDGCGTLLPLWELQMSEMKSSKFMHVDETHYTTILHTKLSDNKSHRGWLWCLVNPVQKIVCFKYTLGRGQKDIRDVLEYFKGILHTDAYAVYTRFGEAEGVQHGKCMSHARRKFCDALLSDPARAQYVLDTFMAPLYCIERECKKLDLSYDEITGMRQLYAVPILDAMFAFLKEEQTKVIPRTPVALAINYTLKIEEGLRLYCTDGLLSMDNNINERQIRKVAIGRKNFMFAGSENGARNAAIIYSFFATCQLHRINPAQWLEDVLTRINDQPKDKLYELLPQFWKRPSVANTG